MLISELMEKLEEMRLEHGDAVVSCSADAICPDDIRSTTLCSIVSLGWTSHMKPGTDFRKRTITPDDIDHYSVNIYWR